MQRVRRGCTSVSTASSRSPDGYGREPWSSAHHLGATLVALVAGPSDGQLWLRPRDRSLNGPLSAEAPSGDLAEREGCEPREAGGPRGFPGPRLACCGVSLGAVPTTNHDSSVAVDCRPVPPRAAAIGVRLGVAATTTRCSSPAGQPARPGSTESSGWREGRSSRPQPPSLAQARRSFQERLTRLE